MGTANCWRKTGSVPSLPGKMKSKRDHSSLRLFCRGDPERMRRCAVGKDLAASVTCASGFLTRARFLTVSVQDIFADRAGLYIYRFHFYRGGNKGLYVVA